MNVLKDLSYGPHGERNRLDLYLPDSVGRQRPLVVCIHGGGWSGGSKDAYAWMGERLTGLDLAAASITYRFWPQWRCPAAIEDVHRAVRWLRKNAVHYGLDAEHVGAIGGSAGAHLASCLPLMPPPPDPDLPLDLAGVPSRVSCVVDCYGPVDFVAMMTSASAPIIEGFMGASLSPETEAAYRAASPFYFVKPTPPPFLIAHGTEDVGILKGQVPLTISERFAEKLRAAGGEVTLLPLEGAEHGFSGQPDSPHTQAMWAAAVPFFRKHLHHSA